MQHQDVIFATLQTDVSLGQHLTSGCDIYNLVHVRGNIWHQDVLLATLHMSGAIFGIRI